jgi:hypothetical protein
MSITLPLKLFLAPGWNCWGGREKMARGHYPLLQSFD